MEPVNETPYYPLVSCIMPTAGRPRYVAHAVDTFLQQDYPAKELIIAYGKDSDLPAMSFPPSVKAVQVRAQIIGAKRNEACRHTQGAVIVQWDDDDIYNTHRLTLQAAPILTGAAHITGLRNFVFFEVPTGRCYLPTDYLFSQAFRATVGCGTLAFSRVVWERMAQYPNWKTGEDYGFLTRAIKAGATVQALNGYDAYVYVRHTANTWKFEKDNFRRYTGWQPVPFPAWATPHLPFYRQPHLSGPISDRHPEERV